jgi:spore coat protein A
MIARFLTTLFRASFVPALFLGAAAASGQVQNITFPASADNTLYEDAGGTISNGRGEHLFAGLNGGSIKRRGVIRFDVGAIPPGAVVTAVTLRMNVSRSRAGTETITVHRATGGWGEGASDAGGEEGAGAPAQPGDATWIHRFSPGALWGAAGGDFIVSSSASASVNLGVVTWSGAGLVADVQGWVNNPETNFGWLIRGNEVGAQTSKRFDSRENAVPARRPSLMVTYNGPPPITGACCLPDGSCAVLTSGDCTLQGGSYQGNSTACSPDPCPPIPTGACCLPTGLCSTLTAFSCVQQGGVYQGDGASCTPNPCPPALTPFVDALPLPAVAQPTTGTVGGAAHYDLAVTRFTQQLHRDLPPTTLYGYGGLYPGPTIEAHQGQAVTVTWMNELRDGTNQLLTTHDLTVDECLHGPDMTGSVPIVVTHLHGGHVPANSDGYPESAFSPGAQSTLYTYPNTQRAATLWYHDHALGLTRLNVYMGMAGFYLLRDANEDALNLPRGEFEIPLVIQDRSFMQDGRLMYHDEWHEHFFGDFILVNGKVWPFLNVAQGKYRFRILNGSNSRAYTLSLSNGRVFTQIGSDGGLLTFPANTSVLTLLPGERADVIVDFAGLSPGTEVLMTNSAPAPFPGTAGVGVVPNVMKFIVTAQPGDTDAVPSPLSTITPILASTALRERTFRLRTLPLPHCGMEVHDTWLINDLLWDDIVESPRIGTTEVWSWVNRSNVSHPMHMHLVQFQVLNRQAFTVVDNVEVPTGPLILPPLGEQGWKDTVDATPGQITRVIARFETHAGLFSYHCHILEHEDNEMMRQFRLRPLCPGDANDDSLVNFADVTAVLAHFGESGPRGITGDANVNGFVDFGDVTTVLSNFGASCL